MCSADLLSQYNVTGERDVILKSLRRAKSHVISQQESAIALYSASAKDLEIVDYFLLFHEIKENPSSTQ